MFNFPSSFNFWGHLTFGGLTAVTLVASLNLPLNRMINCGEEKFSSYGITKKQLVRLSAINRIHWPSLACHYPIRQDLNS